MTLRGLALPHDYNPNYVVPARILSSQVKVKH